METKIVVPALGESVVEATVARWLKKEGDRVQPGESLVELETDKVNLEVGAEKAGVLAKIERNDGDDVKVGETLGILADAPAETSAPAQPASEPAQKPAPPAEPQPKPAASVQPPAQTQQPVQSTSQSSAKPAAKTKASPSARRLAQELGVSLEDVSGTGSGNQITKEDIEAHYQKKQTPSGTPPIQFPQIVREGERSEERVKMSRRRRTIAKRLVEAQHNAAMLTTYNEVDMSAVMDLRKRHKDSFQKRHGVGLGIVSFFVKASIGALQAFPQINAEVQSDEVILKKYYDIGIAVGAEEGLVVPVLRDADQMSFSEIESGIKDFIQKSNDGTLSLEDLKGGTFTITNGGVFGSLMSTPILNPPQVAILGLHKIEERPIAVNGEVVIRPMMYIALSYDHRVVDGRESVQFLARIKVLIEDPAALLLEG